MFDKQKYQREWNKKNRERRRVQKRNSYLTYKLQWVKIIRKFFILKCQECGYDKSFNAIEFHHYDPDSKDSGFDNKFTIKPTPESIRKVLADLEMCKILCSNCHRLEHSKIDWSLINDVDDLPLEVIT